MNIEKMISQLRDAGYEVNEPPKQPFDTDALPKWNEYYLVDFDGAIIVKGYGVPTLSDAYKQGRLFSTRHEADDLSEWERLDVRIRRTIDHLNNEQEWFADFRDASKDNSYFYYDVYHKSLNHVTNQQSCRQGTKYMSQETAEEIREIFSEEDLVRWIMDDPR